MALVLFDLDHTLLSGDSEAAWVNYLREKDFVDNKFLERKREYDVSYRKGEFDVTSYSTFLLGTIKGRTLEEIEILTKPFAEELVKKYSDSLTRKLIDLHKLDICLITSGSLSFLVKEISNLLEIKKYFGTEVEVKEGKYTGSLKGMPNFSHEKVRRVREWISLSKLSIGAEIFSYSDSILDLPMLEFADHPILVEPDKKLSTIGEERQWKKLKRFN
tara:strand:+ start:617 stop:1267 length:651 start_codon:yes stop_codon:yes gene_type:complete